MELRLIGMLLALVCAQAAGAQDSTSRLMQLDRQISQLQERLSAVEAELQVYREAFAAAPEPVPEPASDRQNWRQLKAGMKEADVERLLGHPAKVKANKVFVTWHYSPYPMGGEVTFDADNLRVNGWREP